MPHGSPSVTKHIRRECFAKNIGANILLQNLNCMVVPELTYITLKDSRAVATITVFMPVKFCIVWYKACAVHETEKRFSW